MRVFFVFSVFKKYIKKEQKKIFLFKKKVISREKIKKNIRK
jgi:hypothetical protein